MGCRLHNPTSALGAHLPYITRNHQCHCYPTPESHETLTTLIAHHQALLLVPLVFMVRLRAALPPATHSVSRRTQALLLVTCSLSRTTLAIYSAS